MAEMRPRHGDQDLNVPSTSSPLSTPVASSTSTVHRKGSTGSTNLSDDSRSQQDLTSIDNMLKRYVDEAARLHTHESIQQRRQQYCTHRSASTNQNQHSTMAAIHAVASDGYLKNLDATTSTSADPLTPIVHMLKKDNDDLRSRVKELLNKTLKVHQLEMNYEKISNDYDQMQRSIQKREQLMQQYERTIREQVQQLTDRNRTLQTQLERFSKLGYSSSINDVHALQQENQQLHSLVAQLMPSNKELMVQIERKQLEMHAQASTLNEQRNHIRILDQALHNAQAKVLQLEQERSKMAHNADRLKTLCEEQHQAHESMRLREQQLRQDVAKLQRDMAHLNAQKMKDPKTGAFIGIVDKEADVESQSIIVELRRQLDEAMGHVHTLSESKMQIEREAQTEREIIEKAANDKINHLTALLDQSRQNNSRLEAALAEEKYKNENTNHELAMLRHQAQQYRQRIEKLESQALESDAMITVLRDRQASHAVHSINRSNDQTVKSEPSSNSNSIRAASVQLDNDANLINGNIYHQASTSTETSLVPPDYRSRLRPNNRVDHDRRLSGCANDIYLPNWNMNSIRNSLVTATTSSSCSVASDATSPMSNQLTPSNQSATTFDSILTPDLQQRLAQTQHFTKKYNSNNSYNRIAALQQRAMQTAHRSYSSDACSRSMTSLKTNGANMKSAPTSTPSATVLPVNQTD